MSASVLKAEPDNLRVFMTTHKVRSHGVVFALWIASLSGRCGGAKYLTAAPDEAADAEVEVQLLQTKSALVGNSPSEGSFACSAGYGPGMHIVQLQSIQRQFLFLVPPELAT